MLKAFDVRTPFFRPIWRRLLIVGLCIGWIGVELLHGNYIWAAVFGAAAAHLIWQFFIIFDRAVPPEDKT